MYLTPLHKALKAHANPMDATQMKRYMKNQFDFYGIKAPIRKEILKEFFKTQGLPERKDLQTIIESLWSYDQREYQHVALDILMKHKKKWKKDDIKWIEQLIVKKSWWDTVDMLAVNVAGSYFLLYPAQIPSITQKWITSSNMWLNRTAILFQLKYKEKTDLPLLLSYIDQHKDSKEFFHQKAIGWALREYSKRDPNTVIAFVQSTDLARLSKREALKWINKNS